MSGVSVDILKPSTEPRPVGSNIDHVSRQTGITVARQALTIKNRLQAGSPEASH